MNSFHFPQFFFSLSKYQVETFNRWHTGGQEGVSAITLFGAHKSMNYDTRESSNARAQLIIGCRGDIYFLHG